MKNSILFFVFTMLLVTQNPSFANDVKETTIKGCPNPCSGSFTAQIENPAETFTILIYSTLGEKIFEKTYIKSNNEVITIDISSFKKGIFSLVYKDTNQVIREKIITH